jgi:hypothetical protein
MTEEEFGEHLAEALEMFAEVTEEDPPEIETFARAGLLTDNHGLVVRIGEAEFQVAIVRRS